MVPFMAVIAFTHLRATLFRCPKCRQFFGWKPFSSKGGPWQSQCIHCGIAIGTPRDDGSVHDVLL